MDGGPVEIRLLGPVDAVRDGASLPLGGPRQRALLALLTVARSRPVSADAIADVLWRGEPPEGFRTTVRSYVSRLRHVLGEDTLESAQGSTYTLRSEHVDVRAFERLLSEGDEALAGGSLARARDLYARALDLWRGPALGDVADSGTLGDEAQRLEELRLHCVEQRLEADLALGAAASIVEELEGLVRDHPFRERLWGQLMLALYRSERQADALDAYQRARTALVSELGIEPSERLRGLHESILRHDVADVAPLEQRHNLPAQLSDFVGRQPELTGVAAALEESRLVTLTGVGGVGKTRLALECGWRQLRNFPGGVFFCDLAALGEPALVPVAVARALGAGEAEDLAAVDTMVAAVGDSETLLLMDNCEHLAGACAALADALLSACPRLRILATSRAPLGVPGEIDYPIPPMALEPRGAEPAEAVELFMARARASRPHLVTDDAALEAAARICTDLDGLPLAIELAAARAKMLSLEEIADHLTDRFRFLVSWRRLTPARHQTLAEAMAWSYTLLSPEERDFFARLSVFPAGLTITSAAEVCAEGDEEAALGLVDRLGDASLLVTDMTAGATRYRMLETVRQYAADRLEELGQTHEMRRRQAGEVLSFAETSREDQPDHLDEWSEAMGRRQADLRAALTWSRSEDPTTMARLLKTVWQMWWIRGELTEGRAWLRAGLEHAEEVGPALAAEMFEGAAGLAWAQGDLDEAHRHAEAGLKRYEAVEEVRGIGACLIILGHVALGRGEDFPAAHDYFARSRQLYEEHEMWAGAAVATHNLGSVALGAGDLDEAADYYADALTRYRATGDTYGAALSDLYLGLVAAEAGRPEDAATHLARSLPVFREMGFLQYASQCIEGVAAVARSRGRVEEGVRLHAAAERIRQRVGQSPTVVSRFWQQERDLCHNALGDDGFSLLWEEGLRLSDDEALDRARDVLST